MQYTFSLFSLKNNEKFPWLLERDQEIESGIFALEAPAVAQQVQMSRWVHQHFKDARLISADYGDPGTIARTINPFHLSVWRDFTPTGEVQTSNGVDVPNLHPSTYELEVRIVK